MISIALTQLDNFQKKKTAENQDPDLIAFLEKLEKEKQDSLSNILNSLGKKHKEIEKYFVEIFKDCQGTPVTEVDFMFTAGTI